MLIIGVSKAKKKLEILTVKLLEMEYVSNAPRELFSTFKEDASLLILPVSPMIRAMDFVLPVMLAMNSMERVDVFPVKHQLETLTVKLSEMEFVLNAQKEPFSIHLEFVSLSILHARLTMIEMDRAHHAILDSNFHLKEDV